MKGMLGTPPVENVTSHNRLKGHLIIWTIIFAIIIIFWLCANYKIVGALLFFFGMASIIIFGIYHIGESIAKELQSHENYKSDES